METSVTERKVTSDPPWLKKTSKTRKPEPTDFSVLSTPASSLVSLSQTLRARLPPVPPRPGNEARKLSGRHVPD